MTIQAYDVKEDADMLIIDGNSVYEIDEECIRERKVPEECRVYEKIMKEQGRERNETKSPQKNVARKKPNQ